MRAKTNFIDKVFWNAYNRYWDNAEQAGEVRQRVEAVIGQLAQNGATPPQKVLDAGCGTGVYSLALAQAGFQSTGVDFSQSALNKAIQRAKELKLAASFEKMNLDKMLWYDDGSFEHALCAAVLHWSGQPENLLGELRRVLRPGGMLVITLWTTPAKHREAQPQEFITAKPGVKDFMTRKVKTVAEESRYAHYWTTEQLKAMLTGSGFEVISAGGSPLITVVARAV